jgi:hypothetical protein
MNHYATPWHRNRKSFALVLIACLLIGATGIVLTVVSGGILAYVLAAFVLIAAVGSVHYFVWGRTMDKESLPQPQHPYAAGADDHVPPSRRMP